MDATIYKNVLGELFNNNKKIKKSFNEVSEYIYYQIQSGFQD